MYRLKHQRIMVVINVYFEGNLRYIYVYSEDIEKVSNLATVIEVQSDDTLEIKYDRNINDDESRDSWQKRLACCAIIKARIEVIYEAQPKLTV